MSSWSRFGAPSGRDDLEERLRRDIARGADAGTIARLLALVKSGSASGGDPEVEAAALPILSGDRSVAAAKRYLEAVSDAERTASGWRRVEVFEDDANEGPLAPLRSRAGGKPFIFSKVVRQHLEVDQFDAIMSTVPVADPANLECRVVDAHIEASEFSGDMAYDLTLDLRPLDGETFEVQARAGRKNIYMVVTVGRGANVVVYAGISRYIVSILDDEVLSVESLDGDEHEPAQIPVDDIRRAAKSKAFLEAVAAARERLARRPRHRKPGRRR